MFESHAKVFGIILLVGGAAACGTGDDAGTTAPATTPEAAKAEFWDAMWAGNVDAVPAAREHLLAALDAHPEDQEIARLAGRTYDLELSESQLGAHPVPFTDFRTYIQNEGKYLQHAIDVSTDPYAHALNVANYSGVPYALGALDNDSAKMADAVAMMDEVKREYPALGLFALGPKLMRASKTSPDFAKALEDMFAGYEVCAKTKIDRAHPDFVPVLHASFTERACMNLPTAPHNIEGTAMMFADMLVKNAQPDAARPIYEAIKTVDSYSTWRYRDRLEQRMAEDLAARAAKYDAGDPRSQPSLGASPCLGCHQR